MLQALFTIINFSNLQLQAATQAGATSTVHNYKFFYSTIELQAAAQAGATGTVHRDTIRSYFGPSILVQAHVQVRSSVARPARSSNHQQHSWNSMTGRNSASVDGNYTYDGKEDSARSSILAEVDSGRDTTSTFNIHHL